VSIDGDPIDTFTDASLIIRDSPGETLSVVGDRDGTQQTLQLTPVAAERQAVDASGTAVFDDNGGPVMQEVGYAGFGAQVAFVPQPITTGPELALQQSGAVASMIATLPVRLWDVGVALFTDAERDPNGPLSVVGVGRLAGEVAATDAPVLNRMVVLLNLLGALNIALFVFNMIPLLPLDGGHIVVALWDGVRRAWAKLTGRPAPAPVDATRLVPLTVVVAIVLIGMGALLLIADLFDPVSLLG
jgi:membrane-associated protease RseP (regulator of RpoE activity)